MATESETVMRNRIWPRAKLWTALAMPVVLYIAAQSPEGRLIRWGAEAMVVNAFGSPEQQERLVCKVARDAAVRDGTVEGFERLEAFRAAVDAQRRLAQIDEKLADSAIIVALRDQEERQQMKSDNEEAVILE
jgi:hypothetical protein